MLFGQLLTRSENSTNQIAELSGSFVIKSYPTGLTTFYKFLFVRVCVCVYWIESSCGRLLEYLVSSGATVMTRGPIVCHLWKEERKIMKMDFMFLKLLFFFIKVFKTYLESLATP